VVAAVPEDRITALRASISGRPPRPTVPGRHVGSAGRPPGAGSPGAAVGVALAPAAVRVRDRDFRPVAVRAILVRGATRRCGARGRTRRCSRRRRQVSFLEFVAHLPPPLLSFIVRAQAERHGLRVIVEFSHRAGRSRCGCKKERHMKGPAKASSKNYRSTVASELAPILSKARLRGLPEAKR